MVNTYRMLRVQVRVAELEDFTAEEYQAPILLLAVMIGRPDLGRVLLDRLADATTSASLISVLEQVLDDSPLTQLARETFTLDGIEPFQRWAPRVWRFSFQTVNS
jgi:hypothetical protein